MSNSQKIKITLTKEQWEIVNDNLKKIGAKSIRAHITNELKELANTCKDMNNTTPCIHCKQQKVFWLHDSSTEILEQIAQKTGINHPGLIVSKFIITPLLLKE